MDALQAKVRAVAEAIKEPAERERVEKVIREQALPRFQQSFTSAGTNKNGWNRPSTIGKYGDDFKTRTLIDLAGIWANSTDEVVYFKTDSDGSGTKLDGGNTYTITFAKGDMPADHVKYFWSVIAVDSKEFHVIPNAKNRFLINKQSKLDYGKDGSLTLYFAPDKPKDAPDGNWLPTPKGQNYNLTFRTYGPDQADPVGRLVSRAAGQADLISPGGDRMTHRLSAAPLLAAAPYRLPPADLGPGSRRARASPRHMREWSHAKLISGPGR